MAATPKLLLADLAASGITHLPSRFVRPVSDRPNSSDVHQPSDGSAFPLIDLHGLHGPARPDIVRQIGHACERDGFFFDKKEIGMVAALFKSVGGKESYPIIKLGSLGTVHAPTKPKVKNHGVPEKRIDRILRLAREFFGLPESERMKSYSEDPAKTTRLSTSFNVKTEKVSNWRDFLRLHCYPVELYVHEWPSNPPSFRKDVAEYCTSVRELTLNLLEAISESLGLAKDSIANSIGNHGQHMALNYYPPCPQPELTYGLPGHTDPNLITLLLQDQVPGLQVLRDGAWVALNPIPNTFIINIGDQMQALSNDKYKSVLHRAVVNSTKERISIPTFYCPSPEAVIGPAKGLVNDEHEAVYRNFSYSEYYQTFWNEGLATERCLDMFKVT